MRGGRQRAGGVSPVARSRESGSDRISTRSAGGAGAPIVFVHRACGHDAEATLVCRHCGEPIAARDIETRTGPALRARMKPAR